MIKGGVARGGFICVLISRYQPNREPETSSSETELNAHTHLQRTAPADPICRGGRPFVCAAVILMFRCQLGTWECASHEGAPIFLGAFSIQCFLGLLLVAQLPFFWQGAFHIECPNPYSNFVCTFSCLAFEFDALEGEHHLTFLSRGDTVDVRESILLGWATE